MRATGRLLLAALSGLVACYGVDIADAGSVAPPPFAVPDWSGFYIGGHAGLNSSEANYDYATAIGGGLTNHTRIGRIQGYVPGIYGGYNQQFGSLVVGLEGDVTFANTTFRLVGANVDALQNAKAIYTGAGRVGLLATPTTLVYGKLGYSRIQLSGTQNFNMPFKSTIGGVQYGFGVENLISNHLALRIEAAYTKASEDLVLNQGFDHYRPSFLWVTAGLAYKFDPVIGAEPGFAIPSFTAVEPQWTGIHAAGLAGISSGQVNRYDSLDGGVTKTEIGPYNDLHFAAGFSVGGDLQVGKYFVAGLEFNELFVHNTFDDDVGQGIAPPLVHRFAAIDRVSSFTGRGGVLVTPATLVYAKGGFARLDFLPQNQYFQAVNPAVTVIGADLPSYQIGLGTETMVAEHLGFRIEGLYTRANQDIVINGVTPAQFTLHPSTFTTTAGLVFKY